MSFFSYVSCVYELLSQVLADQLEFLTLPILRCPPEFLGRLEIVDVPDPASALVMFRFPQYARLGSSSRSFALPSSAFDGEVAADLHFPTGDEPLTQRGSLWRVEVGVALGSQ